MLSFWGRHGVVDLCIFSLIFSEVVYGGLISLWLMGAWRISPSTNTLDH